MTRNYDKGQAMASVAADGNTLVGSEVVCIFCRLMSTSPAVIADSLQEERPGRGRTINRSPASAPSVLITSEDSSSTVNASQV